MAETVVDVAIIGAGTAGLSARRAAITHGASSLLIDPGPLGTASARTACVPTKALLTAAHAATACRRASHFGITATSVQVDPRQVLERVKREALYAADQINAQLSEWISDQSLVLGRASFQDATTLLIDGSHRVVAKAVVVATGSVPLVPSMFEACRPFVSTTDDVVSWQALPTTRVLVIGAGPAGLEMGQALSRLGIDTTVVGLGGQLGRISDPVVRAEALKTFKRELNLHVEATLISAQPNAEGVEVTWISDSGHERKDVFGHILLAAGRQPNLAALGVQNLGLNAREWSKMIHPSTLQLGKFPIFVAGDVAGQPSAFSDAVYQGTQAGIHAASYPNKPTDKAKPCGMAIAFTDPQLAVVGRSWRELDRDHASVGTCLLESHTRVRIEGHGGGLIRLYADAESSRLLGAEMCCMHAEHLAHQIAWLIQLGVTVQEALELPFYHPVAEESLRTALRELQRKQR